MAVHDWLRRSINASERALHKEGKESHMAKRTTHRSSAGKKLYAVRDASGRFKDIQTYERAHRADLKKASSGEKAKAAKKR
jgi:hypothetical protein